MGSKAAAEHARSRSPSALRVLFDCDPGTNVRLEAGRFFWQRSSAAFYGQRARSAGAIFCEAGPRPEERGSGSVRIDDPFVADGDCRIRRAPVPDESFAEVVIRFR